MYLEAGTCNDRESVRWLFTSQEALIQHCDSYRLLQKNRTASKLGEGWMTKSFDTVGETALSAGTMQNGIRNMGKDTHSRSSVQAVIQRSATRAMTK